jgi:hypothetical protein
LLQQSKLFAVEVRLLSIKTCKDLNCDKGTPQKEYADREAHGGANLCAAVREAQRERDRERERESDLERDLERDGAMPGREAGKQARERRGPSGNDARARSVHNWRSSSLGPVLRG